MPELKMSGRAIKDRLPRTWAPFFSHFGNFTPIQELTIPYILDRENVVVISPAASGKTEAVIAPLVENLLATHSRESLQRCLRILYISPTRALVNDLYRRLLDPITYCGIEFGRKTGDRPKLDFKQLPAVLLTTPESFDSLLTRQPRIFKTLEAVVLDEIHLLDNTPRGDQLRVLLGRLRKINDRAHYCALSATIDDLDLGARYFSNPHVCFLKSRREIEYQLMPQQHFVAKLFSIIQERGLKKILVFFNARSLAELHSQKLNRPPFQNAVLVHHASLEKQRREEVEQQMNKSERAILCATSTLELGIDIGDVDCIVLFRPPFNVSSLLQRIGRGNRRTDTLFAVGIYVNEWERILFETFFDCAMQGTLYEKRYRPSLSVIPQQVYSYLYQRQRIGTTLKSLTSILVPPFDEEHIRAVVKKLLDDSKIREIRPGIYCDAYNLEKKIAWGKIHSNIAEISFGEYDVYDVGTGRLIGRVFYVKQRFILGGQCWETVKISEGEKKIYARNIGTAPAVTKIFEGKGDGNYCYVLAAVIKKRIFPDMAAMHFPYALCGTQTYIVHFLGALYGFILAESLSEQGIEAIDVDGKMLVVNDAPVVRNRFPCPRVDSIKQVLGRAIAKFEDALGSGAFFYDLPHEYQIEDHCRNLDIDGFRTFLGAITLHEVSVEDLQRTLKEIAAKLH